MSAEERWEHMWALWEQGDIPSPYSELLLYDDEMQNGGHLQFFLNLGYRQSNLFAVLAALRELLPPEHAENLQRAHRAFRSLGLDEDDDNAVAAALEADPLGAYDDFYYENDKAILDLLEEYAKTL